MTEAGGRFEGSLEAAKPTAYPLVAVLVEQHGSDDKVVPAASTQKTITGDWT